MRKKSDSLETRKIKRGDEREGNIPNLDVLVAPLVEELDAADLACDLFGEDLVARGGVLEDLRLAFGHGCCDLRCNGSCRGMAECGRV